MFNSFRDHLHQFALSVDIVDRDILANIREILWQYLHKSLSLQFAEELPKMSDECPQATSSPLIGDCLEWSRWWLVNTGIIGIAI
jgi:hypothetical protein